MDEYAVYKIVNGCQCASPVFVGSRAQCRKFWSDHHNDMDIIIFKYEG